MVRAGSRSADVSEFQDVGPEDEKVLAPKCHCFCAGYILSLLMLVNLLKSGTVSEKLANKYLLGTDGSQIIQHISNSCTKCSELAH